MRISLDTYTILHTCMCCVKKTLFIPKWQAVKYDVREHTTNSNMMISLSNALNQ